MGSFMKTVVLVVAIMWAAAEAQDYPSCATSLIPCGSFLNYTTKPPASCCDPLKDAVNKQLTCLCNLYQNPTLLKSLKINVTEAIRLPTLCGVPGDLCGTNTSTPSTPASGPNGNDSSQKNSAGKSAPTALFSGLLIWASMLLY